MFFIYILKSLDSRKYYIGSTKNVERRLSLHNAGQVQSTKSRVLDFSTSTPRVEVEKSGEFTAHETVPKNIEAEIVEGKRK